MIHLENVSKTYPGNTEALKRLSMHLPAGSMNFLTGRSGAGKTTLLRLIALIERPSKGQIFVYGMNLNRLRERQAALYRRRIGVVFQDHHLLADHTIFDNVALPLIIAGRRYQEIRKRVRAALNKVGLAGKEPLYPAALSGGEQQRAGIARAVVHRPGLLLADEPTGNLDAGLSREIMQLFWQFNQVGLTVLIATHDQEAPRRIQGSVLTLDHGRLRATGLAR